MKSTANTRRFSSIWPRFGRFAFRALTVQLLLVSAVLAAPGLFLQSSEFEGSVEASVIGCEIACVRTNSARIRIDTDTACVKHGVRLADVTGMTRFRLARGVAPRWLRYDLPAPLLC